MAWESRTGTANSYYTRSKRVDGRVVREYLGNGPAAEEATRQDAELRRGREQQRQRQAEIAGRFAAAEEGLRRTRNHVKRRTGWPRPRLESRLAWNGRWKEMSKGRTR